MRPVHRLDNSLKISRSYIIALGVAFLLAACGKGGGQSANLNGGGGGGGGATTSVAGPLVIAPSPAEVKTYDTQTFVATGGYPPYRFVVASGDGTIGPTTGFYTAPTSAGQALVRVIDSRGVSVDSLVRIRRAPGITPNPKIMKIGTSFTFSGVGGTPPYVFSISSGGGTIDANTGFYTAPGTAQTVTLLITDAANETGDATVVVNPPVEISPTAKTLAVNNTFTFSGVYGVPPYTFSAVSGTINSSSGAYTAPNATGTDTVTVTDAEGDSANAAVTINAALAISPTTITLAVNNATTFSAGGGVGGYTYSIVSGGGSIDSGTGAFTAPASSGTTVVRVTDSIGNTSDATVTINPALAISPSSKTMAINNTFTFGATGGVSPYSYSLVSGVGSIDASGVYTAPNSTGTATVRVTDSLGNTSDASITVNPALTIDPSTKTLAVNNTFTFAGVDGAPTYTYSIVAGGGTINSSTGQYTAPNAAGTATIRVTDSMNNTADASVTINAALEISPSSKTLAVNNTFTFSATGGAGTYSYSVVSGGGSIDANSGLYTAPASTGSAVVRVTDTLGNTSDANVTINAALAISPTTWTLNINESKAFSASGGVAPYTFSVVAGGDGSIVAATGAYTAAGFAGADTVRVTDSLGNTADAAVTINGPLIIDPTAVTVAINNVFDFNAYGGTGPYTFSKVSGGGSIDQNSGSFTAPNATGTTVVRVTDSLGATSDATITINPSLAISPTSKTLAVNNTFTFAGVDGVPPYSFSVAAGTGSIDATTGEYTAPASSGTATVRVTDARGNTADAAVTINPALAISPTSKTLAVNNVFTFTGSGGVTPYTFSVSAGTGSIDSSSGEYTAPAASGTATITLTDDYGNTATASVTINPALAISPTSSVVIINKTATFSATGGVTPYSYSVVAGGVGAINGTTGVYTAPADSGTATVRVTDSFGNTSDSAVTVIKPTKLASGEAHNCVMFSNGWVKCWGSNTYGQLGLGDTANRGDGANEMGDNLSWVNLGDGRSALDIGAGNGHTCALLDNNSVKCWGRNDYGQLGKEDIFNRGDGANEMGNNLTEINLGTGVTATALAVGDYHNCVILSATNAVKCWGRNDSGQLGQNDGLHRGDAATEMGDLLLVVNLGAGRTATQIKAGGEHTCAILDTGALKCWGKNTSGQLGLGNANNQGDNANEMNTLTTVDLGTGLTPSEVDMGSLHTCVKVNTGAVKCFGDSSEGQLGQGGTQTRGDQNNETGNNANTTDLNGATISMMASGNMHNCVVVSDGSVKCWGYGSTGQLGEGNALSRGDQPNEMGANLLSVNLGTGRTARWVSVHGGHSCAILDNYQVKCWGRNESGQLGQGNIVQRGDDNGELGDLLNYISF